MRFECIHLLNPCGGGGICIRKGLVFHLKRAILWQSLSCTADGPYSPAAVQHFLISGTSILVSAPGAAAEFCNSWLIRRNGQPLPLKCWPDHGLCTRNGWICWPSGWRNAQGEGTRCRRSWGQAGLHQAISGSPGSWNHPQEQAVTGYHCLQVRMFLLRPGFMHIISSTYGF